MKVKSKKTLGVLMNIIVVEVLEGEISLVLIIIRMWKERYKGKKDRELKGEELANEEKDKNLEVVVKMCL